MAFIDELSRGLRRGIHGGIGLTARAGEAYTGIDALGRIADEQEELLQSPDLAPRIPSLRDAEGPLDVAEFMATGGAEALPSFALMGLGATAGAVGAPLVGLSRGAGALAGAGASSFLPQVGETLEETEARGEEPNLLAASAVGVPQAALDVFTPGRIVSRIPQQLANRGRRGVGQTFVEEGVRSGVQESFTEGAQTLLGEFGVQLSGAQALSVDELSQRVLDSAAKGFGGGFTLGGPTAAVGAALSPNTYIPQTFNQNENPFVPSLDSESTLLDLELDLQRMDSAATSEGLFNSGTLDRDALMQALTGDPIAQDVVKKARGGTTVFLSDAARARVEDTRDRLFVGPMDALDVEIQKAQRVLQQSQRLDQRNVARQQELQQMADLGDENAAQHLDALIQRNKDTALRRIQTTQRRIAELQRQRDAMAARAAQLDAYLQRTKRVEDSPEVLVRKANEQFKTDTEGAHLLGEQIDDQTLAELRAARADSTGLALEDETNLDDLDLEDVRDGNTVREVDQVPDDTAIFEFNEPQVAVLGKQFFEAFADEDQLVNEMRANIRGGVDPTALETFDARIQEIANVEADKTLTQEERARRAAALRNALYEDGDGRLAPLSLFDQQLRKISEINADETLSPEERTREVLKLRRELYSDAGAPIEQAKLAERQLQLQQVDPDLQTQPLSARKFIEQQIEQVAGGRIIDPKGKKEDQLTATFGGSLASAAEELYKSRLQGFNAEVRDINAKLERGKSSKATIENLQKQKAAVIERRAQDKERFEQLPPEGYLDRFSVIKTKKQSVATGRGDRLRGGRSKATGQAKGSLTELEIERVSKFIRQFYDGPMTKTEIFKFAKAIVDSPVSFKGGLMRKRLGLRGKIAELRGAISRELEFTTEQMTPAERRDFIQSSTTVNKARNEMRDLRKQLRAVEKQIRSFPETEAFNRIVGRNPIREPRLGEGRTPTPVPSNIGNTMRGTNELTNTREVLMQRPAKYPSKKRPMDTLAVDVPTMTQIGLWMLGSEDSKGGDLAGYYSGAEGQTTPQRIQMGLAVGLGYLLMNPAFKGYELMVDKLPPNLVVHVTRGNRDKGLSSRPIFLGELNAIGFDYIHAADREVLAKREGVQLDPKTKKPVDTEASRLARRLQNELKAPGRLRSRLFLPYSYLAKERDQLKSFVHELEATHPTSSQIRTANNRLEKIEEEIQTLFKELTVGNPIVYDRSFIEEDVRIGAQLAIERTPPTVHIRDLESFSKGTSEQQLLAALAILANVNAWAPRHWRAANAHAGKLKRRMHDPDNPVSSATKARLQKRLDAINDGMKDVEPWNIEREVDGKISTKGEREFEELSKFVKRPEDALERLADLFGEQDILRLAKGMSAISAAALTERADARSITERKQNFDPHDISEEIGDPSVDSGTINERAIEIEELKKLDKEGRYPYSGPTYEKLIYTLFGSDPGDARSVLPEPRYVKDEVQKAARGEAWYTQQRINREENNADEQRRVKELNEARAEIYELDAKALSMEDIDKIEAARLKAWINRTPEQKLLHDQIRRDRFKQAELERAVKAATVTADYDVFRYEEADSIARVRTAWKRVASYRRALEGYTETVERIRNMPVAELRDHLDRSKQVDRTAAVLIIKYLDTIGEASNELRDLANTYEHAAHTVGTDSAAEAWMFGTGDASLLRSTDYIEQAKRLVKHTGDDYLKAMAPWVRNQRKALGIKTKVYLINAEEAVRELAARNMHDRISRLIDGSMHGLTLSNFKDGYGVFIHPHVQTAILRQQLLAHEMGHVVFRDRLATATEQQAKAILQQFHRWRNAFRGRPTTVANILRTKKPWRSALLAVSNDLQLTLNDLDMKRQEYLFDFEEWFADETSKALLRDTAKTTTNLVQRFFNAIADLLRKLTGLTRHTSVEQFINELQMGRKIGVPRDLNIMDRLSIYNSVAAAEALKFKDSEYKKFAARFEEMTGQSLDRVMRMDFAKKSTIWGHIWNSVHRPDVKGRDATALRMAWLAAANKYDPFGGVNFLALRYAMENTALLTEQENKIIQRAAQSPLIKRQLLEVFGNKDHLMRQLNNPQIAAAYMFQLWNADMLKVGPQTETLFTKMSKRLDGIWGTVSEFDQADKIMHALRDGVLNERANSDNPLHPFVEQTLKDKAAAKLGPKTKKVMDGLGKVFLSADDRMRNAGIPAFVWMADQFHARTGNEFRNETYHERKAKMIGRFDNLAVQAYEGKDHDFGQEVVQVLNNPDMLRTAPADVQRAVKDTHSIMKHIRAYVAQVERKVPGFSMGDLGEQGYFPWVFDTEYLESHKDEFVNLLSQPKYERDLRRMAVEYMQQTMIAVSSRLSKTSPQYAEITALINELERLLHHKKPTYTVSASVKSRINKIDHDAVEFIEAADMPDIIYSHIMDDGGVVDTELDPQRIGHVPRARFANKRSMKFVTDLGSSVDRAEWSKFLSTKLGHTMRQYIESIVKRVEYVRLFGANGEVLQKRMDEAERAGATRDQIQEARRYVNAMLGTHGFETNMWLAKNIGFFPTPKRRGEPINPTLQKGFSVAMVYQNLRLLSLATLTSLVDPLGIAVRTGDFRMTWEAFKQGIYDLAVSMKGKRTDLHHLADTLGIIDSHLTNEALGWQYGGVYMSGLPKRINDGFFKWIGLQGWTKTTRIMALAAGRQFIKYHVKTPNERSTRFLSELGLTPEMVTFTADGELDVFDEARMADARKKYEDGDKSQKAVLQNQHRVRNALYRFVDESILRPTAAQRPIWASDPHFMLVFHLKSFMYSFHDRILRRAMHEAKEGHYAPLVGLGSFVPTMIASDMVRDVIQHGGTSPHKAGWDFSDYVVSGVTRSGVPGLGNIGLDAANDINYGGWGLESLAGPTVQQALNFDPAKAIPAQNLYRGWLN